MRKDVSCVHNEQYKVLWNKIKGQATSNEPKSRKPVHNVPNAARLSNKNVAKNGTNVNISTTNSRGLFSAEPTMNSEGQKLTEGQQEYFKGPKNVDKNDNLFLVYHGTSHGGFTMLGNDLKYFTANKKYA